jgi:SAM-dependent methyltransferase
MDFDKHAETYRASVQRAVPIAGFQVDRLARMKVSLLQGLMPAGDGPCRALDLGCGIGLVSSPLAQCGHEVHGIDISAGSVALAAEAGGAARFHHFDGTAIPFPDGYFDIAFTICVLHHVPPPQWQSLVVEMTRVVKPGGKIAIFEHNPLNPVTRHIVANCELDIDAVLLRAGTATALLRGAGLENVHRRYIAFSPWRHPWIDRLERLLTPLPLGAQYYCWGTKPG